MNFNINTWMKGYLDELKALFGSRLLFVGLQGSFGRGEATESSDIDAVVILDQATPEDLKAYGAMLDKLPNREKVCGFNLRPAGAYFGRIRTPIPETSGQRNGYIRTLISELSGQ